MTFHDGHGTSGHLQTVLRALNVTFTQRGAARFTDLPNNLFSYTIRTRGDAAVTPNDVKAILHWPVVKVLRISQSDSSDVAYALYKRIQNLSHSIEHLALTVQRKTYKKLNVNVFLRRVLVNSLTFEAAADMPASEFEEFVSRQKIPKAFSVARSGDRVVTFQRRVFNF